MGDAINIVTPSTELEKPNGVSQFITYFITYKPDFKSGDLVVLTNHRKVCLVISSLISVNSDSNHKRLAQNTNNMMLKVDMHFEARIGSKIIIPTSQDLDHLWSFCRNFNEVKYEWHLYKDEKSRVLFDKPIMWPVTHLVLIMNQMLTGPGI